ncbi:hypothetical protein OBP_223 [Pseudomonas phage OBP]|uniref:hypothetical protein n=1 Tax=Pseudomonas phage OBP TaxID=1124849 RepID=UPI000240D5C3|nr:hypothetical protein OBP_223 [Pseudomonas phage OBP]AEV89660.1 hypothetical protein OBP_223 [Pseudomonas phage OBP]
MLSKNKDWFRFNRYFRCWERVLLRGGGDYTHQVSVDLTPVNDTPNEWDKVREVTISRRDIRFAAKPLLARDIVWTHHLPDEVYDQMVKNLGKDKADFLVHADIYKLVDWNEYSKYSFGASCALRLVRRDLTVNFRSIHTDEYGTREIYLKPSQFQLHTDISISPNCDMVGGVAFTKSSEGTGNSMNTIVIYYDHINQLTAIEIKACIPEKEELNTRIIGRHGERWDDRITNYMDELVSLGYFNVGNIGVVREISANAWTLIQSGNI